MVQNGDSVTYFGNWITGGNGVFQVANDLLVKVTADLNNAGLAVRDSHVNQGLSQFLFTGNFSVQLELQVENGLGFAQPDDIRSVVDGAVVSEGGSVQSSSIPYQQTVGGTPAPTGQPTPSPIPTTQRTGCIAGTSNDLNGSFSLGCWFSNLTSSGLSTVGMLAIVFIVGLILLTQTVHVSKEL